jgi:hypothetical protein
MTAIASNAPNVKKIMNAKRITVILFILATFLRGSLIQLYLTVQCLSAELNGKINSYGEDFDLRRHEDNTFGPYPFFQPADISYVTPTLGFSNHAYRLTERGTFVQKLLDGC